MKYNLKRNLAICLLLPVALCAQEVLTEGHFDFQINYDTGTNEWVTGILDYDSSNFQDGQAVLHPSDAYIYQLVEKDEVIIPAGDPWQLIGTAGETAWVLPEIFTPGRIYLGIGTQTMERGIFTGGLSNRGQINIQLKSVTGSGVGAGGTLTMWAAGFPPIVHYATADGIDDSDRLTGVPAGAHSHYNWAFSKPGDYVVTFEVSGVLTPQYGGGLTSTEVSYYFRVGEASSVSLFSGNELGEGWFWNEWLGAFVTASQPWIFSETQGWWYVVSENLESSWVYDLSLGWLWVHKDIYPSMYSARQDNWIEYTHTENGLRWFYVADSTWISG